MMTKKRLLFSGLGGSPFPYLHNKLLNKYDLYYVDADEQLRHLYNDVNFQVAPFVTHPDYFDFIRKLVSDYKIDYYIPLIDEEIVNAKINFNNVDDVKVITPDVDFSLLCLDKYGLMQSLSDNNISFIKTLHALQFYDKMFFPAFVKPNTGRGSRGVQRIENLDELNAYYTLEKYEKEETIVQEFVSGVEYTVGVTVNNLNQILSIASRRIVRKKGITIVAVNENNIEIERITQKIVDIYKPCGPFNIQLYITPDNEIKIFEINPRYSTTIIMSYEGGIDEVSLYIDNYNVDCTNFNIKRPAENIVLHRRWESCFYEK